MRRNGVILYSHFSMTSKSWGKYCKKICFSFCWTGFHFLWSFLKFLCHQNMAHYVQWNLPEQCSHSMLMFLTQILSSQKGKSLWLQTLFCSQSFRKLSQGSYSFIRLKILQPTITVIFQENHHWIMTPSWYSPKWFFSKATFI